MGTFIKSSFAGGLNSQIDPTKLNAASEHYLGINIRVRRNTAKPVRAPLDISGGLPTGIVQGIYTFGTTVLVFVNGQAYYRQYGTSTWTIISSLQLSPTVPEIDCALVPASSVNFVRSAPVGKTTQSSNGVVFTNPINSSPECLVVMDGVSQPWLIYPNATARVIQNYAQWSPQSPEYVPIGRFPIYVSGILYCVGKDNFGRLTQIYRSVSGRPLDYVILLDDVGNKISASETEGGAPVLAHRVSYDPITELAIINATGGGFLACTQGASWVVTPDYTDTIAAEPTFTNQTIVDVGAVTKNSVVPVLGDTTIICRSGIRSFNGVENFRWQGKNAPFSAQVNNFIANRAQTTAAGITYDDYALYALETAFGPGILVFDMLLQKFVGLDLYENIAAIKQFASVNSGTIEQLFFYTSDNKVYEAFAGNTQRAEIYLCDLVPNDTEAQHRIVALKVQFSNIRTDGYVEGLVYSDRLFYANGSQLIMASGENLDTPVQVPFAQPLAAKDTQYLDFTYTDLTVNGWRATAGVAWDSDAELLQLEVKLIEAFTPANDPTPVSAPVDNVTIIAVGADDSLDADRVQLNTAMQTVKVDQYWGLGAHTTDGTTTSIDTYLKPFWNVQKELGKFVAVAGAPEMTTSTGVPFYAYMQLGPTRYFKRSFGYNGFLEVFGIVSGYVSGVQVEPSNLTQATIIASEQMQWLKAQLASSTAKYKVVTWYDTVRSSNPFTVDRLTNIPLKSWGADLLICGNSNCYERLVLADGFPVINVATGHAPQFGFIPQAEPASRKLIQGTAGYLKIVASPLRLNLFFVDNNNNMIQDRYTI